MKEETALRKEKEAVCCYVHVDVSCTRMHIIDTDTNRQLQRLRKPHIHV